MSLVFAAAIPNAPQLAGEMDAQFSGTHSHTYTALLELVGELYFMKPDTIIFLTSSGSQIPELFNTNISSTLSSTWPASATRPSDVPETFTGDVAFAAHLKETIDIERMNVPMTIVAESVLPEHISVPLSILLSHLPTTQVVIISTAQLQPKEHVDFGEFLRHAALDTNKRIAVIASGSLAQNIAAHNASTFDTLCTNFIRTKQQEKISCIDTHIVQAAQTDIYLPLVTLIGVLHNLNVEPSVLSYEQLHDSGQLVANFILK